MILIQKLILPISSELKGKTSISLFYINNEITGIIQSLLTKTLLKAALELNNSKCFQILGLHQDEINSSMFPRDLADIQEKGM